MPVHNTTLKQTPVYRRLVKTSIERAELQSLVAAVDAMCPEAVARLKAFAGLHPQYTLHDEVHCERVVELMGRVLGPTLDQLNGVEIAILILAAYFHDQGMVIDSAELATLKSSEPWKEWVSTWRAEHPNWLELSSRLSDPLLSPAERDEVIAAMADLDSAVLTDYLRKNHGELSAKFIVDTYGADARLAVHGHSIASILATVCRSHVLPASSITYQNGYHLESLVGTTKVNVAMLAFVLRLSDILDFDRDRTPDSLFRAINFKSEVSLREWEKHRSVSGWDISAERIAFSAECEHPAYQRAILQFIGWIDDELASFHQWRRSVPSAFDRYLFVLPAKCDASRVSPRTDPVNGQPIYRYLDLEFTLARDDIVKLLMTDRLYSERGLFVRELLQNALDALRYRDALFKCSGSTPPPLKVEFEHSLDTAGFDVVRCVDNGVGMDEDIVQKFLTRAGRSYYRSPEFERERARFRERSCDFDPCARFGIGFMSCFMFGDQIKIETRRDRGMGEQAGEPLVIDIAGLSGIVRIRAGKPTQPIGTTVEVRGRRKSFAVDEWDDAVNMIEVLEGYALGAEYPIIAERLVPALNSRVAIVPQCQSRPHILEEVEGVTKTVLTCDLASADSRLRGEIRVCMLVDDAGSVVVRNDSAAVVLKKPNIANGRAERVVQKVDGSEMSIKSYHDAGQACCDGILVAGVPGRCGQPRRLGYHSLNDGFGGAAFIIDARGDLKPALTPARTPPSHSWQEEPSWTKLFRIAGKGYANLLNQVIGRCSLEHGPATFWEVAAAYDLRLDMLSLISLWDRLRLPMAMPGEAPVWRQLQDIGELRITMALTDSKSSDSYSASVRDASGAEFVVPDAVKNVQDGENGAVSSWLFRRMALSCSEIEVVSGTELSARLRRPTVVNCLQDHVIGKFPTRLWMFSFADGAAEVLRIAGDHGFANLNHPVIRKAIADNEIKWEESDPLSRLCKRLAWAPAIPLREKCVPTSWPARWRASVALLHQAIDWTRVHSSLRPPYKLFIPGVGVESLDGATIATWLK